MKRFIIDSDGTNFFGRDPLTREDLRWTVAQLPEAVTTFMLCPNWIGRFMYPCAVGERALEGQGPGLHAAWARGEDPFGELLALIRDSGREAFITYRMNDVHDAGNPESPSASAFKKAHPEWTVDPEAVAQGTGSSQAHALDYSRPEVRAYFLASLRDLAEKYDVDGFQLDWMRFPRNLSGETEEEVWGKRDALTEFTADVRAMLDEIGSARSRRIMLSARVATSPEGCRRMGADAAEWTGRRLLDFLTIAPFLSTDFSLPFGRFRDMLPEPTPICAGMDISFSGRLHIPESYRAWALAMHDLGADGLNIFNFPCWTEIVAEHPYHWIADLLDPAALARQPLLYPVIIDTHRSRGIDMPVSLPAEVTPEQPAELTLHLPEAALPPARANLLIAAEGACDLSVAVNDTPLDRPRFTQATNLFPIHMKKGRWQKEPEPENCRLYFVSPDTLRPGPNALTFTGRATLTRCDLGLWPDNR